MDMNVHVAPYYTRLNDLAHINAAPTILPPYNPTILPPYHPTILPF